jgi:hypothetical protein
MNLQQRLNLLAQLGNYLSANEPGWQDAKQQAERANGWFTQEFIDMATSAIVTRFLDVTALNNFAAHYKVPQKQAAPKQTGLVMAGNLPMVGLHDWLCIFLSGHRQLIKTSSKDDVLIRHLTDRLVEWDSRVADQIQFATMLKGCDAYIATGSNNTARYFDYYFSKYPSIIRRNRTSVAILSGRETTSELVLLADDVHQYFGLGCRNVTKIYVPKAYDFVPLLEAFKKYSHFADHNKYRNNYDYQLALLLLNSRPYMTNNVVLLAENEAVFSPISQLHYEFYTDAGEVLAGLTNNNDIQCIVAKERMPFGQTQVPSLTDFADGVDTMNFLIKL